MHEPSPSSPPGNWEVIAILAATVVIGLWLGLIILNLVPGAIVPTAYAIPLILLGLLLVVIRLMLQGTAKIPIALGLIGVVYIVGGGLFDMVATVVHSPSLDRESNLLGRALLDSGHSIQLVYFYAILAQSLWLTLMSLLWLSLLRHRKLIVEAIGEQPTFWHFLKAASGGRYRTWRQWWLPLRISELPSAYPFFWLIMAIAMGALIDRWYLGLEWFRIVGNARWIVDGGAMALAFVVYHLWLYSSTKLSPQEREPLKT